MTADNDNPQSGNSTTQFAVHHTPEPPGAEVLAIAEARTRVTWMTHGGKRWTSALVTSLVLALAVAFLDAVLPGLPVRGGGPVGAWMAFMSGICPQRPAHSYTVGGVQLPIEARMVGIFGGFFFGVFELATVGRRRSLRLPSRPVALALLLGFTTMAFDGTNALLYDLGLPHAYAPDLRVRLATGIAAGLAMAFGLVPTLGQIIAPVTHASVQRVGWHDVGLATFLAIGYALLVASGWAPLLVPVSAIAVAGVVLMLLVTCLAAIAAFKVGGLGFRLDHAGGRLTWQTAALATLAAVAMLAALAFLRSLASFPG